MASLEVDGGNINQPNGSASDIIVSGGTFNWDGGNINIGTTQSNLQLMNVTGNISGNFNRNFGDNLIVNGSTVMMTSAGQWTFNLGTGITISNGGTFEWLTTVGNIAAPDGGQILNNGGTFLLAAGTGGLCDLAYVGNANPAVLDVQGGTMAFNGLGSSGYSVEQNSGTIQIAKGATLTVLGGLQLQGGVLTTLGNASITGSVDIEGGTVSPGGNATSAALYCSGSVRMYGGTYLVTVDATNSTSDLWYAGQGFTLGGTATLTVNTVNIPGTGVPAGMRLPILTVANGQTIVGDFATKNVTYAPGKNYRTGLALGGLNYLLGT